MARLQDFQSVTPSSSDNLLIVQATGQGLANYGSTIGNKAPKSDLASISITGTTNTSGRIIKVGEFFYLNGSLVRAIDNIGTGATFTSGTNYEVVTAGGLSALGVMTSATLSMNTTNVDSAAANSLIKRNGMVQLDVVFYPKSLTSLQNKDLATIPSGYIPPSPIYVTASLVPNYSISSKTMAVMMQINSNGVIRCPNLGAYSEIGAVTPYTEIFLHCCYMTNT